MRALVWSLYLMWVCTAFVYAQTVASKSTYVAADLVNLPWDQLGAAASLAFAGGAVAFLTRLNMGQVNSDRLMREFSSDVVSGAFLGAIVFAWAADQQWTLWRTFVAIAVAGTSGGIAVEVIRGRVGPVVKRFLDRVFGA